MKKLVVIAQGVLPPVLWLAKGLLIGLAMLPAASLIRWSWAKSWWLGVISAGPAYFVFGMALSLGVVVLKRVLFYRARPGAWPFLCFRTVIWALVAQFHDMAAALFLHQMRGSWFLNVYFRLLGARIGRNVIINSTHIGDWDLIDIGDDTMIGDEAVITGHLGEKGQLCMAPVRIGKKCTIGRDTCIFPGAIIEDGVVVAATTVVPKNKTLPAGTMWGGTALRELGDRSGGNRKGQAGEQDDA